MHQRIIAIGQAGLMRPRPARVSAPRSGFAGFRFPPDVITVAVRWYLRYGLSYRDVEELLVMTEPDQLALHTAPSTCWTAWSAWAWLDRAAGGSPVRSVRRRWSCP
ncbi:MAG TPA: hypothetical protein VJT72_18455 [Pseudonocardiaceae bacterium]|nr:hypothetical protein [Pseudonocardiaceae bacterium]